MDQLNQMTLTFRCPPGLEDVLPPPIPAVLGLPDWFKALPQKAFNPTMGIEVETVKKCPPFIDAMTYGFLIPLAIDLNVQDGEFNWDFEIPKGIVSEYSHSPIGFHDPSQIAGTPLFEDDRFIIKFNNFWTIEAPPGYSLLFTHPANRTDLPFTTITGLVDSDKFYESPLNFPARWRDTSFNGVLRKGPPDPGTLYGTYDIVPADGSALVCFATRDGNSFFTGGLDEVAIYPRVLTGAEIMDNYTAGIS